MLYRMQKTGKSWSFKKQCLQLRYKLQLISPSHRLLHCIHVSLSFPQLPFSVPSIFSFSQQYLSDAVTSEAEQSFLSVRDTPHELFSMSAIRRKHARRTLLHYNVINSKNCSYGSQECPISQASITQAHFSQLLL